MKLWALSDLHVGHTDNRRIIEELPAHPQDWLALAGDLGETPEHLEWVLRTLSPRFARLLWVPGNHELWTSPRESPIRGEAKYAQLVDLCRRYDVLTPEDPYPVFDLGDDEPNRPPVGVTASRRFLIAPLFALYDYSYAPAGMDVEAALDWAYEAGLQCADEMLLEPDPHATRQDWCAARVALSEARLTAALAEQDLPTVLINHFPLVQAHAELPFIPRFVIWCGTQRTEDWHRRFRAAVVVYGHLHIPKLRILDGVRFHEVSLGYPRQWRHRPVPRSRLRQILPVVDTDPRAP